MDGTPSMSPNDFPVSSEPDSTTLDFLVTKRPSAYGSFPTSRDTFEASVLAGKTLNSNGDDTDSLVRLFGQHAASLTALRKDCSTFIRRSKKLDSLRGDILLRCSGMLHAREQCRIDARFLSDSLGAFTETVKASMGHPTATYTDRLHSLQAQVVEDFERHNTASSQIVDMEEHLSNSEYELQRSERKLIQVVNSMMQTISELPVPKPESSGASSEPDRDLHEDLPGLVEHYFEKVGDVKIERERLWNLRFEHVEARAARTLQVEQDRLLELTDEKFETAFEEEYQLARQSVDNAVRKAELARAVCLGEDIDPEDYRRPRSRSNHDSIVSTDLNMSLTHVELPTSHEHDLNLPLTHVEPSTSYGRQYELTQEPGIRIKNWIDSVQSPKGEWPGKKRSSSEGRSVEANLKALEDGTPMFSPWPTLCDAGGE